MKTVLVVDDSPEVRADLRPALEMHGYRVLEAGYLMGVEAMATCNSDVRAVVLDGWTPWAIGQEPISSISLALLLRESGVRVIFHSGDMALSAKAAREGLTVVPKGSGIQALLEAINDD
ncbi:MAG TPA: hypothetical protein DCP69_05545 [Candidatus Omnitrophica bacterium]|nr:hypothetical protein [Candidatus Omnitrophota bacterium]